MSDRIPCICSKCRKPFTERAVKLKHGYEMQCPHCMKLIIFDNSSEDPNIRRPLKMARELRIAAETILVQARIASQMPSRDPNY
jgi:DNA-directed RNA polymerase subunit RPC12/RpoP